MDIRELRIGDKVTHLGKLVTIRAIYGTGHVEFIMSDSRNFMDIIRKSKDIEPIPLTDELIKFLGFKADDDVSFSKKAGNFMLIIAKLSNRYCLNFIDYTLNYTINKRIKYLHQLQHELFDARVEFKIEL